MKPHARLVLALAATGLCAAHAFGYRQKPGGDYQPQKTTVASAARGTTNTGTPSNAGWDDRHLISPRKDFQRKTGFPSGRPGYVVEYIVPLSRGGTDTMDNMRWTAVEDLTGR